MSTHNADTARRCDCMFCRHNEHKTCDCQPCDWVRRQWPDLYEGHNAALIDGGDA